MRQRLQKLSGRVRYFLSLPGFRRRPLLTLWRAISWKLLCLLGIPGRVRVPAWNNAKLILPPEWHGAGATLFYVTREYYEAELTHLRRFVREGETFVDAGANCGVYTIAAAGMVGPQGRVFAFEPGRMVFATLKASVEANRFDHVSLFPFALGEKSGEARLYSHAHGASSFSLGDSGAAGGFTIRVETLDKVLEELGNPRVDCVKMDVEGAEELILRGAVRLFERCRPRVIFEVNRGAIGRLGLREDGAWGFLKARGYRMAELDEEGRPQALAEFPGRSGNFIALPPGEEA